MWDLRLPAGLFFFGLGIILCVAGLAASWRPPLDPTFNVNLYTGIGMLVFGAVMLWLAWRRKSS
jgi:uncharacterized membrane protein HdeD (DUF308 family)